jgi:hypothetical protein
MPFEIDLMQNKVFREVVEEEVRKSQVRILCGLLTKRFRRVPAWARERIKNGTADQRESWLLTALDGDSIEDVAGKR